MNRKQFLMLLLAVVVLGAASVAVFWQDIAEYRASGANIGAKLLPEFKIAEVARIELKDAKNSVTLDRKENYWVVAERENYPAEFKAISDFIIKLADLKVVQADTIGESLLPRVELVEPGKGDGAGTLVTLKDPQGKVLATLILGKKVLKKDPGNPLPSAQDGVPAGRYIRVLDGKERVVVVSDPLNNAEARAGMWLDKDFAKIDRVRTLTVGGEDPWKITRDEEWGQWKFAGGPGALNAGSAVAAVNALGQLSFSDVALNVKPEAEGRPVTVVAETFDNLVYTLKVAKREKGDDYLITVAVSGELPRERAADPGEKAEDKERRDKDYAELRKRMELRLARDKARADWTYVVEPRQIEPILRSRSELVAPAR